MMGGAASVWTLLALTCSVLAVPVPDGGVDVSGTIDAKIPPILSFDKGGNVGVNFLGFKASAGLGGLLTGDTSLGGLHAEAETPFGQKAGAGLGGAVDANGRSAGGLYAGATAGGGVGAAAGIDGEAGVGGRSYAGASAGGISKTVIKETPAQASFSGAIGVSKHVAAVPAATQIDVVEEKPSAPTKTYIERTVVPNYVEKTIQVPSYVEKTIRVPTVVEKTVRVPAPPTIIEKRVDVPPPQVDFGKSVVIEKGVVPAPPPTVTVVEKTKTKFHRRPHLHYRKKIYIDSVPDEGVYGGYGGYGSYGGYGGYEGGGTLAGTATVRKTFNPQFIQDIFNIPIATLGAVSNLVGGIAGGGSVSVSKTIN
ncbi:uncharacterized protein LOC132705491 [Cylas formicarius]|uniref:uncharacterized protein LOC132705491 n=1 Tax=Cylas formicarius TaxID=197179 RepID=UPI0029589F2C|nr:uncharacterized protein LOC132705491 [Cylas formicarius]XP_060532076.1 uncharacterized protein LOC132705491 [Cylas formicarius]